MAQVKENNKNLLKWIDYNSSISEPIDKEVTYDYNVHGRYEERICQVYDDLYQIKDEYKSVNRIKHSPMENIQLKHTVIFQVLMLMLKLFFT